MFSRDDISFGDALLRGVVARLAILPIRLREGSSRANARDRRYYVEVKVGPCYQAVGSLTAPGVAAAITVAEQRLRRMLARPWRKADDATCAACAGLLAQLVAQNAPEDGDASE